MALNSIGFARRIIGFALWWLASVPVLTHGVLQIPAVISAVTLIFWIISANASRPFLYRAAGGCYVAGLVAMLILTSSEWLFSGTCWGILLACGLFAISLLRRIGSLSSDPEVSPLASPLPGSTVPYPYPVVRFVLFYLIWMTGFVVIACASSAWQTTVLVAWTCAMLITGYQVIWPFAAYPEWLGYQMRRQLFVSKMRWGMRFLITGLLIAACIALCIIFGIQ